MSKQRNETLLRLRIPAAVVAGLCMTVSLLWAAGVLHELAPRGTTELGIAACVGLAVSLVTFAMSLRRRPRAKPVSGGSVRRIGAYQLHELLGKGGMGEVWRAGHASLIRPAALKLIRPEVAASSSRQELESMNVRFQREVQATATLTSPHTVAVFDYGRSSDGTPYYVMELLNGLDTESLVVKYGPQPAERVVHVLRHVCESLEEAHHRSLIHRDIKPANIHLCAIGMQTDFAKVLDFGLVRDLNVEHRLTIQGTTPGTPAYVAPETLTDKIDHRSDLYALGCVAYWMLTGHTVFEAATRIEMLAAHSQQQPVAPSKRVELPIPVELDDLILALLAKNPNDRPQSARELSERLAEIPLATPWTHDRSETWWRVHLPEILAQGRAGRPA